MDSNQLADASISANVPSPLVSSGGEEKLSRESLERSRRTILYGWIISMIGVVSYCFLMPNGDQQTDLPVLIAIAIILIGVGFWFAGYIRFLNDANASTTAPLIMTKGQ